MTPNTDQSGAASGGARQAARDEANEVKDQAKHAAKDVAGTVKDEARDVKDEAVTQARGLASSASDEVASQASTQQQRLAQQSRAVTDDLHRIQNGEQPQSELVANLVSAAAERAEGFTRQLESKEPADLLEDVRRFAARRPGTFLAVAVGVGLLAGRLTRGLTDSRNDDDGSGTALDRRTRSLPSSRPSASTPPVAAQPATTRSARTEPAGAPRPEDGPATIDRVPGTVYHDEQPDTNTGGRP